MGALVTMVALGDNQIVRLENPDHAATVHDAVCRGDSTWAEDLQRTDVKAGHFSKAEQDSIRAAVNEYAAAHNLSTDDFSWLTNARKSGHAGAVTAIAAQVSSATTAATASQPSAQSCW